MAGGAGAERFGEAALSTTSTASVGHSKLEGGLGISGRLAKCPDPSHFIDWTRAMDCSAGESAMDDVEGETPEESSVWT